MLGFIGLITISLIVLRFIWVYIFWEGSWLLGSAENMGRPKLMSSILISLSGVRGAVTLAAAFSIPFVLQDGSPFPERDLIIFLAAGVILCSLLIASVVLPLLSRRPEGGADEVEHSEYEARVAMLRAGIAAIREATDEENEAAARKVLAFYHRQLLQLQNGQSQEWSDRKKNKTFINVRLAGLQAERREIQRMLDHGEITGEMASGIEEVMNQMEMVMSNRFKMQVLVSLFRLRRLFSKQFLKKTPGELPEEAMAQIKAVRLRTSKAAIEAVKNQMNDGNREASMFVMTQYNEMIERLQKYQGTGTNSMEDEDMFNQYKSELRIKGIQAQRNEVQAMFERGDISWASANKLRQYINYLEAGILEPDDEE